jgi:hypothetical protein
MSATSHNFLENQVRRIVTQDELMREDELPHSEQPRDGALTAAALVLLAAVPLVPVLATMALPVGVATAGAARRVRREDTTGIS